ncbi:IclR family transcriptional regulator [Leifsonia sp. Root112D2]|uniref:IclR family transcriptional regulator n=1 Tax=Leifsonia sp. Root112D2 TaxID=1736426 RepID=UPI0006F71B15|nr:IclR family transcriptional regulator [Leifsonia sp. Root112D2]KQV06402.1 IclR family transcriptional regulator [Leifsonia sp. Root112D2]
MDAIKGAQVVSRVGLLLRTVSGGPVTGMTSAEIVASTDLTRPTTHRLLAALAAEGLVDQDRRSGRWFPGPELYLMGSVSASRYDVTETARETVRSIAARTGESAFFSARRGDETVCLIDEEGSFPLRSFVLHEGIRFPLGVASAGLVILAFLPEGQAESYFRRHPELSEKWGGQHSEPAVTQRAAETRRRGYSVNPGLVVEGSYGMAAAVFGRNGEPSWALSITGVESRFPAARRAELGALLLDQAHELGKRLQDDAASARAITPPAS